MVTNTNLPIVVEPVEAQINTNDDPSYEEFYQGKVNCNEYENKGPYCKVMALFERRIIRRTLAMKPVLIKTRQKNTKPGSMVRKFCCHGRDDVSTWTRSEMKIN